jgi:hypothetical protein
MTINSSTTNHERQIELSLAPKEYSGTATHYVPTLVLVSSLEKTLKSHNYSPIHWADNYRSAKNFCKAVGFCLDIDGTMIIEDALAKLSQLNLNFALVTTKSHSELSHRFRVLIPFNRSLLTYENYKKAATALDVTFGSICDLKVFDGARQLYGSPDEALYYENWSGVDFDVTPFLGIDLSQVRTGIGDWSDSTPLKTAEEKIVFVGNLDEKTSIYCPFHEDTSPSAFVEYAENSNNWFVYCSACGKTFWKTKIPLQNEERCRGYWSHAKGVYEVGLVGGEFIFKDIGDKKFFINVGAYDKKDREGIFRWLVENQHLSVLRRIDLLGDGRSEANTYEVLKDAGIVEVRYAPLSVETSDNQFIEDYLEATFKDQKDFIKEYLACYCYTNHRPLPTLILVGKRGTGKNTFAEAVAEIFKPLSSFWEVSKDQFNPAYEKKLLIADETITTDKKDYIELKKIAGQNEHNINKKFTPHYSAKNNINVIILSNRLLPIFVESSELPSSPEMNQFFVYEFPQLSGPVDAELARKLRERLGYYVRTALRRVYEGMEMQKYRYGMKVPITDEERRLFNSSVSEEDEMTQRFIQQLVTRLASSIPWDLHDHVTAGYVPKDAFIEFQYQDKEKRIVVRRMRELGYLSDKEPERIQENKRRQYCYKMLDPMKKKIENDLGPGCFAT